MYIEIVNKKNENTKYYKVNKGIKDEISILEAMYYITQKKVSFINTNK